MVRRRQADRLRPRQRVERRVQLQPGVHDQRGGQDQTRVTHEGKPDFSPSFSPDGQRIVYVDTGGRDVSLATIHADGAHHEVLLRLKFSNTGPESVSPTYAPSGERIVFAGVVERRNGLHSEAIWSVRTDGSHLHRLTKPGQKRGRRCDGECFDVFPYWAPDGHHIIFWRCSGDCDLANAPRLSIMRADGWHKRQLAWQVPAGYLTPSVISPSGDLFAFANYDGDCHIDCLINIAIAPRVGFPSQDITHNDPSGRRMSSRAGSRYPGHDDASHSARKGSHRSVGALACAAWERRLFGLTGKRSTAPLSGKDDERTESIGPGHRPG